MITHEVSVDPERQVVVKRYVGLTRDGAAREWRALRLLAEHAPRLAPEPISADLDADPPSIVMSLLPGEPLGGRSLTPPQERAIAVAVGQLWQAVPVGLIAPLHGEVGNRAELVRLVRDLAAAAAAGPGPGGVVAEAVTGGTAWFAGAAGLADLTTSRAMPAVLGQGDANLANFLWDGEIVRLVDFEDSGVSDRAFELAVLVEHVSAWRDSALDADRFTGSFDLSATERATLPDWRRLAALHWLLRLRQRGDASELVRQAERMLSLL